MKNSTGANVKYLVTTSHPLNRLFAGAVLHIVYLMLVVAVLVISYYQHSMKTQKPTIFDRGN